MASALSHKARLAYGSLRRGRNRLSNLIDPPVVVLLYHRVTSLPSDPQLLAVTPAHFRSHLQFLKERYRIVRFDEEWANLKEPAVAITFDDGYADNLLEALPILEEERVAATFFVSTGTIGTRREFWWDELERIVFAPTPLPTDFRLTDRRLDRRWPTQTLPQRERLYRDLLALLMQTGPAQRETWFGRLREWGGLGSAGRAAYRALTKAEVKALAQSDLVTIGAHTASHTPLSILAEEEQRREIAGSKLELETLTGAEVRVFSYPFGRKCEYNRTSLRICREAGFAKAAANFPGQAHRWTDPLQVPRQLVRDWDIDRFAAAMEEAWV